MRKKTVLALVLLLSAGGALAVTKGDTLYIRSRNTRVVDKPNGRVVATLQPGEKVTWNGTVAGAPGWHQVKLKTGRKGVLLTANLATQPPPMEIRSTGGGKPIDQATFLSSGAATKALAPAAIEYAEGKPDTREAVKQVQAMERLSDSVTLDEVAAHTRAVGLPVAVGGGKR